MIDRDALRQMLHSDLTNPRERAVGLYSQIGLRTDGDRALGKIIRHTPFSCIGEYKKLLEFLSAAPLEETQIAFDLQESAQEILKTTDWVGVQALEYSNSSHRKTKQSPNVNGAGRPTNALDSTSGDGLNPPLAYVFLLRLLDRKTDSPLVGDLLEGYPAMVEQHGIRRAGFWFRWHTLGAIIQALWSLRPTLLKLLVGAEKSTDQESKASTD